MSEELPSQHEHESDDDRETPARAQKKRDRPNAERGPLARWRRLQSQLRAQERDEKRRLQSQLLAQARDEKRAALSGTC